MDNLDVLKMILMVDELRQKAKENHQDTEDGRPFRVDEEGAVVDVQDLLVYEPDNVQPGDAEIIVEIYNRIGFLDWDDIHPLVELVAGK